LKPRISAITNMIEIKTSMHFSAHGLLAFS
jgi:hypothetical protein